LKTGSPEACEKLANFLKVAKIVAKQKMPKSTKHLHLTTIETLKYLQQIMFINCLFT
jgi:DNA-binding IclR family transcriptional regulator